MTAIAKSYNSMNAQRHELQRQVGNLNGDVSIELY